MMMMMRRRRRRIEWIEGLYGGGGVLENDFVVGSRRKGVCCTIERLLPI